MITVQNLKKQFGANEVLKDISTTIQEKEVVCVIGPSGSGKSTFLRCLNLLEDVTSGKVTIGGVEVTSPKTDIDQLRTNVGMVFQQFNLFPHLTVLENIMLAPKHIKKLSKAENEKNQWSCLARSGYRRRGMRIPSSCQVDNNSV